MIEDDFFATIKLKCGDEIFCKVAASEEEDRTMLLVSNPIVVEEMKTRGRPRLLLKASSLSDRNG